MQGIKKTFYAIFLNFKNHKFLKVIVPWFFFALCFFTLFFWILLKVNNQLNSDMSAEMILGKVLAKNNNFIFSTDWFYSTELRVLYSQILYGFLFRFLDNWKLIRIICTVTMYVFMLFSLRHLLCALDCKSFFPIVAGVFLLPITKVYENIVLTGGYYIPNISLAFFLLGNVLFFVKKENAQKRILNISISGVISLFMGMGGLRCFLVFFLPLFFASFVAALKNNFKKNSISFSLLLISILLLFLNFLGVAINVKILSKFFDFMIYGGVKWTFIKADRIASVFNNWLEVFCFSHGAKLFSKKTLSNFMTFLVLSVFTYSIAVVVKSLKKSSELSLCKFFILFNFIAVAMLSLFYCFVDMDLQSRYLLPVAVYFPIMALCLFVNFSANEKIKKLALAGLCLVLFAQSYPPPPPRHYIARKDFYPDQTEQERKLVSFLLTNGYENGYATFWHGGVLTELSNGKIDVYGWHDSNGDGDQKSVNNLYKWLQEKRHWREPPVGKIFMVFSDAEHKKLSIAQSLPEEKIIYSENGYIVYGFASYESIMNHRLKTVLNLAQYPAEGSYDVFAGAKSNFVSSVFEEVFYDSDSLYDDEFVFECYNRILDREADKEGALFYIQMLNTGRSRQSILNDFLNSDEFKNLL